MHPAGRTAAVTMSMIPGTERNLHALNRRSRCCDHVFDPGMERNSNCSTCNCQATPVALSEHADACCAALTSSLGPQTKSSAFLAPLVARSDATVEIHLSTSSRPISAPSGRPSSSKSKLAVAVSVDAFWGAQRAVWNNLKAFWTNSLIFCRKVFGGDGDSFGVDTITCGVG